MKRGIFTCGLFLLLAATATAQEESKLHFLLNGGLTIPQSPDVFKDGWKQGFNVGGGLGYRLSRHITVQATVNYDRFPFDEEGVFDSFTEEFGFDPRDLGISIDITGADMSVLSVSGELKASFVGDPSKISPYVIGGGGLAHLSLGSATFSGSYLGQELVEDAMGGESETKLMATIGGGVDIPINERIGVFVEARYQFNFTSEELTNFAGVRGGVKIGL